MRKMNGKERFVLKMNRKERDVLNVKEHGAHPCSYVAIVTFMHKNPAQRCEKVA